MKNNRLYLFLLSVAFSSCHMERPAYKYYQGTFPESPVNMSSINSPYDDYNSTSPILGETAPLCFSSNRNSAGKNFDIIYKLIDVIFNRTDGTLSVTEYTNDNISAFEANSNLNSAISTVNTTFDELGPYLIPKGYTTRTIGNGYYSFQRYILLYASNESGNFDIKFTQNVTSDTYSKPANVAFLNSAKDDAYPTLMDTLSIYLCSNRENNFDIYKTDLNQTLNLLSALSDTVSKTIVKDETLSSDSDDKCPFILGNLMVFTSNRPGGYGGFDLYYSVFKEGKWSTPTNFGDKINTSYDEYRPIVKTFGGEFTNDFMIFSSNRPGGKGGFDLYYVGINQMTK